MPEIRDYFPEYDGMEVHQLLTAKEAIQTDPSSFEDGKVGAFAQMLDEPLGRLLAITRSLRKKAASPGTGGGRKRAAAKASSLESLA